VIDMKHISSKDAKNGFGRLMDTARSEPVIVQKHGRPFVVVLSVEEYERLVLADQRDADVRDGNRTAQVANQKG